MDKDVDSMKVPEGNAIGIGKCLSARFVHRKKITNSVQIRRSWRMRAAQV